MPTGPENLDAAIGTTVDPVLLAIILVIFIVGAVVPLGGALLASFRDDFARRRDEATRSAVEVTNPVAANVVAAAGIVELQAIGPDTIGAAANDVVAESSTGGAR